MDAPHQPRKNGDWRRYQPAIAFGTNFAAGMAFFTLLGYWADRRTGGGTRWTLVGLFAGLFYGGYELWKVIRDLNRKDDTDDRPNRDAKS